MSYADTLPDAVRRRARRYAIASTLFGCISEVMLASSAIIILLLTMLNATARATMFSTCIGAICSVLLFIPMAVVTNRLGLKQAVHWACGIGCFGFLLIAASPFCGMLAIPAALIGITFFYVSQVPYGVAWYPLLDNFLQGAERGRFFGVMRTIYMIFIGILFFIIGLLLGKEPPFWLLQAVIALAGICILGRSYCVSKFPLDPDAKPVKRNIKAELNVSIHNAPLTGFSVYICLLSVAYTGFLPLILIYLRRYVQLSPGTVQILSSVGMGGSIIGYLLYSRITGKIKLKWLELSMHLLFILLPVILFLLDKDTPGFIYWVGTIIFLQSVGCAGIMCNNSVEYLALARPGNKTMATAFCQTYANIGGAIGRIGLSLLLGCALLSPVWEWNGRIICVYQSLFLLLAAIAVFALVLLPILPSFVPEHDDYYDAKDK